MHSMHTEKRSHSFVRVGLATAKRVIAFRLEISSQMFRHRIQNAVTVFDIVRHSNVRPKNGLMASLPEWKPIEPR